VLCRKRHSRSLVASSTVLSSKLQASSREIRSNQFAGAEYLEAALRLNTQKIETTEHYMRLDNISLLARGSRWWGGESGERVREVFLTIKK
jgi:hypothetical protein